MNVSVAARGAGRKRYLEWAADALREVRWPQVRGTMLFGVAACAFASLINLNPLLQFLRTLPAAALLLGYAIDYQIKAFVLLAAVVIADRAVDEGARPRSCYITAALAGCVVGVFLSEMFSWAWRAHVLPPGEAPHSSTFYGHPLACAGVPTGGRHRARGCRARVRSTTSGYGV